MTEQPQWLGQGLMNLVENNQTNHKEEEILDMTSTEILKEISDNTMIIELIEELHKIA
jgi:hypothetical protein